VGIPKFLFNSSLFSKVLFLLFVDNYETIPKSFWHDFYILSDDQEYMPRNLKFLNEIKHLEISTIVGGMLARHGTKVLIVDKEDKIYSHLISNSLFKDYLYKNRL
jgi:hypothetical protein